MNCKQQTSEQTLHCRSSASCFGTLVNSDISQGLTASFSAEIKSSYSEQMHPKHVLKYDNKFLKRSILHSSDVPGNVIYVEPANTMYKSSFRTREVNIE